MRKFLLSATVLVVFTVYALHTNLENENTAPVALKPNRQVLPSLSSTKVPVATLGPTPAGTPISTPAGRYKDGIYTGGVADAFYGNIQVRVTISGGKITDVVFLQYPSDRRTSQMINSQAMPLLKEEAIQAQSAQVDGVSGATASSGAFIQSLQDALSQAG